MTAQTRRIAIIGTGFSGLCLGYHFKKRGFTDFTIFEKADAVGGTWRDNTYPGAECDIPSALYSFSFERNPNWTFKWSEQEEILNYMNHCCDKFELRPHIKFNCEVTDATFNDAKGNWAVTAGGKVEDFDVVVSAVGQLHKPSIPHFDGAETFEGSSFHSAKWDHSIDLAGKQVAVVGNAASALQFIPQIAPLVAHLDVYQRSANWVIPKNDREYTGFEKWLGSVFPPATKLYRFGIWLRSEALVYPLMNGLGETNLRKKAQQAAIDYMEEHVSDPDLRTKLIPDYPIGAKRILFSDDFYDGIAHENTDVVTDPIVRIVKNGIVTEDGTVREADVLIYATGFISTDFLTPMEVKGRNGVSLNGKWNAEGAEAYLGITHTGFPNFFMMYGPNTNLGHNSIILMIEAQTKYILSCLDTLDANGAQWLDVTEDAQTEYNKEVTARLADMTWSVVDDSWYKRNGKITNNWMGRTTEYMRRTKHVDPTVYEFGAAAPQLSAPSEPPFSPESPAPSP